MGGVRGGGGEDDHHKLTSLLTGQLQRLSRLVREDNSPSHPQCIAQVYVARSGYIPGKPCGQKVVWRLKNLNDSFLFIRGIGGLREMGGGEERERRGERGR